MAEIICSVIDADELLRKVRNEVLEKGVSLTANYKEEVPEDAKRVEMQKAIDQNMQILKTNIQALHNSYKIEIPPIENRNIIKRLFKRFTRKCMYWLCKPIIDQQTQVNASMTRAIAALAKIEENMEEIVKNEI